MERLQINFRSRRTGFVLTPLIDVIFLLLTFFMLSSRIAPFGLLPVTGAASPDGAGPAPPQAAAPAGTQVVLRVSRGHVSAGRQTITIGELPAAIEEMKRSGVASALLMTTRSATVQDVVSTLEAFKRAAFADVAILNRPGDGP